MVAVVVNHNRQDLLLRALTSLRTQSQLPERVLVVDNGSCDGSVAAVRDRGDSSVQVIEVGENLGSSGGFHRGMAAGLVAGASHLLLLDSDVVLAPDCVAQLTAALARDPHRGIVGPKVYHWDSTTVLQEFGGWIDWSAADLRRSHWRHDESRSGTVTADQRVDYVPACCLLVSRAAVEAAGNFDPGWFLYWDDIDWCDRARVAGFAIAAVAGARVQHFGGGANKRNLVPVYYGWRNRLTFFRRRTPPAGREATLRAFAEDYLLAHFTCGALGLTKTAAVMQRAVEDALTGVFGRQELTGIDLSLDAPVAALSAAEKVHQVHHVIGSAAAELAAQPGAVLRDRFGKQLLARRAWELRQEFEILLARELPGILARAT